ncbi:MAG: electron transport complex subunit RsxC [Spirochaetales bacterium]|nr:electron transport complex subunit RsxC [Spirochaetales bacterium]
MFSRSAFQGGVNLPHHKERTAALPIRRLPFADVFTILCSQHTGNPAIPLVRPGQEVERGECIARADGFFSVPMHSPVNGQVQQVGLFPSLSGEMKEGISIKAWPGDPQILAEKKKDDPLQWKAEEIVVRIQGAGMVGLGGAAFPTHVKFAPGEKRIHTLIINGCECEPYLTADHRVMVEMPDRIIDGAAIAIHAAGAERAIIAVEDNKPDAIAALRTALNQAPPGIEVQVLPSRYPQGAEKILLAALLGMELKPGQLPLDLGILVSNVSTLAEIALLVPAGNGLIERVITVSGPGVKQAGNYLVPIGTPLDFLLETVGITDDATEVISGGPMMGLSIARLSTSVTKAISGILVLATGSKEETKPCIRCGACLQACPLHLNPGKMGMLALKDRFLEMAESYHLFDCFECGCCSYVCPSRIPLVQHFRMAKKQLRKKG